MKLYVVVPVILSLISSHLKTGQCGTIANKIALSLNEARSFFGRGGEKFRKRWLFFSETKDLQEECHTETGGCNVEEVMEFYNGDTTDANNYWTQYKCPDDPDSCSISV
ncbi:hypothetical protein ABFA07_000509 [Porites harrisoni]